MSTEIPQAMNETVILLEDAKPEESKGGILLLPNYQDDDLKRGTIISVGPGRLLPDGSRVSLSVVPGDQVLFSRMAGVELKYDQGSYLVLPYRFIVAVVE